MSASVSAVWLLYLSCYLPTLIGGIVGQEHGSGNAKVVVEEGTDAVLPCLISTKEDIVAKTFDWKKDGQQEVFLYDAGDSNANRGQDLQFKGRVSHFQDQLMNGNASIKIQNTKVTDSGTYMCIFPHHSQAFNIELVVRVKVVVEEGSDAVLPCLISTEEDLTGKLFDWRKDGQKEKKEVFMYDLGFHSNSGFSGQDLQFKGRVSHFQDQLKNGNASIKIQNTKMADSGNYSCDFPRLQPRQTFIIQLVVEAAPAPEPYIRILNATVDGLLLQCEVRGASPKPKVEWQDISGNILPAEQHVSEKGGRHYVSILTTVTRTDHYRCEVTQEEISHHIYAETHVFISGNSSSKEAIGLLFGVFFLGAAVLAVVQAGLVATKYITIIFNKGADPEPTTTSTDQTNGIPLLQVEVTGDHQNENGSSKAPPEIV